LLDLFLRREPFLTQAQPLWEARDAGTLSACLPASVVTDIFYIVRKQVGSERAFAAVDLCLRGFEALSVDAAVLERARGLSGPDFEDNVQIACALSYGLDLIITRNLADFADSPIPAIEPGAVSADQSSPGGI
jgi:predicted nucleic acid-binding protein